jgi:hypothetical protein
MATYTQAYYPEIRQYKKHKKISVIEKVVNLGGDYPARRLRDGLTDYETGVPYALNDVIEVIGLRAGTTVLDIEVELLTVAGIYEGAHIDIGDGNDTDRYGRYDVQNSGSTGIIYAEEVLQEGRLGGRFHPYRYASADTIDVKIRNGIYAPYTGLNQNDNVITTPAMGAATGWTVDGVKWAIAGGVATRTAGAATPTMVEAYTMLAGRYYWLSMNAKTLTAGAFSVSGTSENFSSAGIYNRLLRVTTAEAFTITSNATHAGTLDDVYLYPLDQNVAKFIVRAYILEDDKLQKKGY